MEQAGLDHCIIIPDKIKAKKDMAQADSIVSPLLGSATKPSPHLSSRSRTETKQSKTWQKSYFDVLGICCSSEIPQVENIIRSLDGIVEFSVVVPSRTVIVVHDNSVISQQQIVKALNQGRLEANVRTDGAENYKKRWPSPFAITSGALLALSFLKFVYYPLEWLAVGAVAAGIFPIISKTLSALKSFRIDINFLALTAALGTLALRDFTEAGTVVFLFTIAAWLESTASHKATAAMSSLMSLAPRKAVIAETGEEVDADKVTLNTVLAVRAGEVIPIDGVVVDGQCEVDEKSLTGESFPVLKQKDYTVFAGTININGYISVRTTVLAEDCVVAQMGKLVEEAQNSKSRTQRFIDKWSLYYTPGVLIIAACFAIVPAALRVNNLENWCHLALVVLVSGCPCGLILSTPVATFCALTKAAKAALLIKGADYLETLAKTKVVAFDKTGTITRGEFVVTDFQSLSRDVTFNTLLYWVSSIESKSSHPMAVSLVDYARSYAVEPKPDDVEDYRNFPGEGVCGEIGGYNIYIGNKKIAVRADSDTVPHLEGERDGGKTKGYIYCGSIPVGVFSLSDSCRSGVYQAIKELNSLGIKAVMLTGDNQEAAMHAQQQLGNSFESVYAELLPEDKSRIITELKKQAGPTVMVGDGMNDAPALATADVGISMGISGSALATDTGNILLMSNDIRRIPNAIKLARRCHRKIIENVILSVISKGAILSLAFAGHPIVWAAVLADVGSCLLVILNSMLLLHERKESEGKCYRTSVEEPKNSSCCNKLDSSKSCSAKNVKDKVSNPVSSKTEEKKRCCGIGGCKKENEETSDYQNVTKRQCPADLEVGQQVENCKSGCCGPVVQILESNKKYESEIITVIKEKTRKYGDGSCESSCCGPKAQNPHIKE